mmetsp:Transcript_51121/g.101544  ORF Transcript_51121/g.101544 Transcript_51121/m.101544 type:complete len:454 (-) Transcript_51121:297-1658(-)
MVGNPGTGKSSTMNCMLGVSLFQSGVSRDGTGVTFQLDVKEHEGTRYMDTPGLSDVRLRKAAAKAIEEALLIGGDFKIIFVTTLQRGRIHDDDLLTMKLVLEAANQIPQDGYAIMINQISEKVMNKIDKPKFLSNLKEWLTERGVPVTEYVHFALHIDALADEDNVVVDLPLETLSFLQNAPQLKINGEKVTAINAESFDEIKEALAEEREHKKLAEHAKELAELREKEAQEEQMKEAAARKQAELAWQEADRHAALQEQLRKKAEQETHDAVQRIKLAEEQAEAARAQVEAATRAVEQEAERARAQKDRINKELEVREQRQLQLDAENKRLQALAGENEKAQNEARERARVAEAEMRERTQKLQRELDVAKKAADAAKKAAEARAKYPDGTIIRAPDAKGIFKVEQGQRRWFSDDSWINHGKPEATMPKFRDWDEFGKVPNGPHMPLYPGQA